MLLLVSSRFEAAVEDSDLTLVAVYSFPPFVCTFKLKVKGLMEGAGKLKEV